MILAQSLRLRLSGSRYWLAVVLGAWVFASSCTGSSRIFVPRETPETETTEPVIISEDEVKEVETPVPLESHRVALLLPFQLDHTQAGRLSDVDVDRASLALDFYQGFTLGLERLTNQGVNFRLDVLDSQDEVSEVVRIARLDEVRNANLVVGPVFPTEIKTFTEQVAFNQENVLMVSPLAATMPNEFNAPDLVSITSPIIIHVQALAREIVRVSTSGDAVILFHSDEMASQQFLSLLEKELLRLNPQQTIYSVEDKESLHNRLRTTANNLIVCGSTNRFRVTTVAAQLLEIREERPELQLQLFGHPNWSRISFPEESALGQVQATISSSYYIDQHSSAVRTFEKAYEESFHVEPTEFAYKGYDAAYFFGTLLARYGHAYKDHLLDTPYKGLHNSFEFEYNVKWGFVNHAIHFLTFQNGRFVRLK